MGRMSGEAAKTAAAEAARTVPPGEHGGNCDIKNLSRGSKVYFPVYVKGGGLSMSGIHFSQGDGEITFCGAIEMAGYLASRNGIPAARKAGAGRTKDFAGLGVGTGVANLIVSIRSAIHSWHRQPWTP